MRIARELGMTCYRSREEFDSRFNWDPIGDRSLHSVTFEVESYMDYQVYLIYMTSAMHVSHYSYIYVYMVKIIQKGEQICENF